MSMINISHLSFAHYGSTENIFDDVSLVLDTDWKLGLIGRNGKGKTTFLNLLLGAYEYEGQISAHVVFDYFPFTVPDENLTVKKIAEQINPNYELWKLECELDALKLPENILERNFATLSKGEQTKVLLGILFSKENNFLLIDEPTNHLDDEARHQVANYLRRKSGFILVSHDRTLLDSCVDHILAINRANIELTKGNFSSWYKNKIERDNFEMAENKKLKKEIKRLGKAARDTAEWSDRVEATKIGAYDKGAIGHQAAKMMKRSLVIQARQQKAIEEKSKLLKNIEETEELKFNQLKNVSGRIFEIANLSLLYGEREIVKNVNFFLEDGDRLQIKGSNGSGKSSLIKLLTNQPIEHQGNIHLPQNLKISYVPQDTSHLNGSLNEYIRLNDLDENLFKAILRKLDLERECFRTNLEDYSEGQKKKVLLAKSLSEPAQIYIWDEPLNYIDVFSRIQIEDTILKYKPTMIFVEHDEKFADKIATKTLLLK